MTATYPCLADVREEQKQSGWAVVVLVHFDAKPASHVSQAVTAGQKHAVERAGCAAVIRAAIEKQVCPANTQLYHFRRRGGETRVFVVARYNGSINNEVIRTGIVRHPDKSWAAAEACLAAIRMMPTPESEDKQLRICL